MRFSFIIPSYNQDQFIEQTLDNLKFLKEEAIKKDVEIELLLFDNCSNDKVLGIIEQYRPILDYVEIKKDKGQFDAINNGIVKVKGDYWTWLNTDDLIDIKGFFQIAEILKKNPDIDYIFGKIRLMDENNQTIKYLNARELTLEELTNRNAGIMQPGSFFRTAFTQKIGLLHEYDCCFDYEYLLRMLSSGARFHTCDFIVSEFRLHSSSKSGSTVKTFIAEELKISKQYGRRTLSWLTLLLQARRLKRKIFN